MSKYLLKFIKYILSSSKDWTGVGIMSYRDVYPHSTSSISRGSIVLFIGLALKSKTQLQQRLTIKLPPVMMGFLAFGKKPEIDC
jgi:hypothetical protein